MEKEKETDQKVVMDLKVVMEMTEEEITTRIIISQTSIVTKTRVRSVQK